MIAKLSRTERKRVARDGTGVPVDRITCSIKEGNIPDWKRDEVLEFHHTRQVGMVEIMVVERTADMHERYVGGTAGIDGTVVDRTKFTRDGINRIIEDGAGSIVVR